MQKQNGGFHDFAPSWMKAPDKNGKMVCWLYSNELFHYNKLMYWCNYIRYGLMWDIE